MNAEDILAKHHCTQTEFEHKSIIAAMQEFAEQEAVEFAEWAQEGNHEWEYKGENTYWNGRIGDDSKIITTAELFKIFKQRNNG